VARNRRSSSRRRPDAPQPIFHQLDLRDAAAIEEIFKKYDADGGIWAVIHLAALKAVGESGEKPLAYYRVNVGGSISLMEVRDELDYL
jgi:UDP-glucose 4-epimerase